ncbi:MAG: hypothetical protein JXB38_18645, partial [Anaerolineales bacterium]|nr:hypothetical protein [Anaerolineales bacterium]
MKKKITSIFLLAFLILFIVTPVAAQTYSFSLDRETVDVYWNEDGTLTLEYEFVFTNATGVSPIDFVDVGLPTPYYSISDITASVDGNTITNIESSPYVTYGVALGLAPNTIQPGDTGTVRMRAENIRNVLYEDSQDSNYASAVFTPTWFDSDFVYGSTNLTVTYHMPPGVQPEEPRYHGAPSGFPNEPDTGFDDQGLITYTWRNASANGYTQYLFGASFPKTYVPASTIETPTFWQRVGIDPDALMGFFMFCCIGMFFVGIPILSARSAQKRKLKYLPPKVAIEGHGVKRGLTAVEAAILMEQPMDKILTMILFGVLKKDAATVVTQDPLKLEVEDPLPEDLRPYEKVFLEAFQEETNTRRKKALQSMMATLVKNVTRKMKGFSRKETIEYYENIMKRAWAQIEAEGTPEVKSEKYDQALEWTMLDKDYDDRTRRAFQGYPVFVPTWWGRYDPGYGRSTMTSNMPSKPSAPSMQSTRSAGPSIPGADFAASVANGASTFSAGVIGNLTSFTGGVTQTTNPPPKPSSSSYRGGSSGGSSCACACA